MYSFFFSFPYSHVQNDEPHVSTEETKTANSPQKQKVTVVLTLWTDFGCVMGHLATIRSGRVYPVFKAVYFMEAPELEFKNGFENKARYQGLCSVP